MSGEASLRRVPHEATESSPLLAEFPREADESGNDNSGGGTDGQPAGRGESGDRLAHDVAAGTSNAQQLIESSLSLGVACCALVLTALASSLQYKRTSYFNMPWELKNSFPAVAFWSAVAIVFGVANIIRLGLRHRSLPTGLLVVLDLLIAFFIAVLIGNALLTMGESDLCSSYWERDPDEIRACRVFVSWYLPLLWAYAIFSTIFGLTHFVLFVIRCIEAYRARAWQNFRVSRWTVPTGSLSFEFTIKLLHQERETDLHRATSQAVQAQAQAPVEAQAGPMPS